MIPPCSLVNFSPLLHSLTHSFHSLATGLLACFCSFSDGRSPTSSLRPLLPNLIVCACVSYAAASCLLVCVRDCMAIRVAGPKALARKPTWRRTRRRRRLRSAARKAKRISIGIHNRTNTGQNERPIRELRSAKVTLAVVPLTCSRQE